MKHILLAAGLVLPAVPALPAEAPWVLIGLDIHMGAVTVRDTAVDADTVSVYGEGLPVYPTAAACQDALHHAIENYAGRSHAEGNYGYFLCVDTRTLAHAGEAIPTVPHASASAAGVTDAIATRNPGSKLDQPPSGARAHTAWAGCERATKEEKDNCLHWANLNLDWSPQLKQRRDEIIARIGKHFYAWREYGEGFTVIGIIDHEKVKVQDDHHPFDNGIHAIFAEFPSQEWVTKDPYAGKDEAARHEVVHEFEKRCASGHPRIGMTELHAYLEWCHPWDFHKTETSRGVHEQWVYESSPPHRYLYFDDGYLTGIQE